MGPPGREGIEQQSVRRARRGVKPPDEADLLLRGCQLPDCMGDGIRGRGRRDDDAGVLGQSLANLVSGFRFGGRREGRLSRVPERQRVADGRSTLPTRSEERRVGKECRL